jgi:hypothetical protein
MSRSSICVGDKYSFESYGVLKLIEMHYDMDEYVFTGRSGGSMTFRREELTEKVYDAVNQIGDRVDEPNHGKGRIIEIKETFTHWPYHIVFDDGYDAWYGADAFEVVTGVGDQRRFALRTVEREIAHHQAKLDEWQAIKEALEQA